MTRSTTTSLAPAEALANQRLFSPEDAGAYLSVSRWTVYRLIKDGELLALPVKGVLRLDRADLDAYADRLRAEAATTLAARKAAILAAAPQVRRGRGRPRKCVIAA